MKASCCALGRPGGHEVRERLSISHLRHVVVGHKDGSKGKHKEVLGLYKIKRLRYFVCNGKQMEVKRNKRVFNGVC